MKTFHITILENKGPIKKDYKKTGKTYKVINAKKLCHSNDHDYWNIECVLVDKTDTADSDILYLDTILTESKRNKTINALWSDKQWLILGDNTSSIFNLLSK